MSKLNTFKKRILVTGGAGFIGSELVRRFVKKYPEYEIVCFDALTYAGNLENLKSVQNKQNYEFVLGDIRNREEVGEAFVNYGITDVIHLAAESHVDRSITGPRDFIETNVIGTFNLLETARHFWKDGYSAHRFHHVSTDEVYGSLNLGDSTYFHEETKYDPHSPYSASKASSDHFVKAYHDTYGLNVTISNCSNNYGPYQFPEKLIPLAINNLRNGKKIPIYGKGDNVRDWLYVGDHADAIDLIFHNGKNGDTYNVGGMCEMSNYNLVLNLVAAYKMEAENWHGGEYNIGDYIEFVADRKGHDMRYAIDCTKLMNKLGWYHKTSFVDGLKKTVRWYLDNGEWLDNVTSGDYKKYYEEHYGK